MTNIEIHVKIRPAAKPESAVRAYADVSVRFSEGVIVLIGFAVVHKKDNSPFVGFPSKPGTTRGKFFPIVDLQGNVRALVCRSILDAYRQSGMS